MDEGPDFNAMTVKEFRDYADNVYAELSRLSKERFRIEDFMKELREEFL